MGLQQLFKIAENRFEHLIRPKTHEKLIHVLTAATLLPTLYDIGGKANFDSKMLKVLHGDIIDSTKTMRSTLWDATILGKIWLVYFMVGLFLLKSPDAFQLCIPYLCQKEKSEIVENYTLTDLQHPLLSNDEPQPESMQLDLLEDESFDDENRQDEYDPTDPAY